jgi:hypothetical protein
VGAGRRTRLIDLHRGHCHAMAVDVHTRGTFPEGR